MASETAPVWNKQNKLNHPVEQPCLISAPFKSATETRRASGASGLTALHCTALPADGVAKEKRTAQKKRITLEHNTLYAFTERATGINLNEGGGKHDKHYFTTQKHYFTTRLGQAAS